MPNDDIRDMVIAHDRVIEHLAKGITDLQALTEKIFVKLDAIPDIATSHNVLSEKVNNLESNVRESFNRRDIKIDKLDDTQNGDGCTNVRSAIGMAKKNSTDIGAVGGELDTEVKRINKELKSFVSGTVVRWALPMIVGALVSYASYAGVERKELHTKVVNNSLDLRSVTGAISELTKTAARAEKSIIEIHSALTADMDEFYKTTERTESRLNTLERK